MLNDVSLILFERVSSVFFSLFFFVVIPKGNIWLAFLYLLGAVSTTASWHKYVKRMAAELPFMALKININT